ncbi:MAG: hypothetical protein CME70_00345 [Halobacteriovorax sp.]|nr:hypothetical protein [Halobacteriovorax sp.]|tara:strand:- start:12232 stop:12600 length:369 start_codon:yes stop_codon:yes gene_type:complete
MQVKRNSEIKHSIPSGKDPKTYPYAESDKIFHTKQLFLYSEKVAPGKKASAPHLHSSIDEIIVVTKGELCAKEGSEEVLLNEGDSICFEAGSAQKHFLENRSSNDAEFLIFRRAISKNDVIY